MNKYKKKTLSYVFSLNLFKITNHDYIFQNHKSENDRELISYFYYYIYIYIYIYIYKYWMGQVENDGELIFKSIHIF